MDASERLDKFLARMLPEHSRSKLVRLIDEGLVLVNGRVERSSFKLAEGTIVELDEPSETGAHDLTPAAIPLDVIFEDAHLLVVNKPRGLAAHPAISLKEPSLVNALLARPGDLSTAGGLVALGYPFGDTVLVFFVVLVVRRITNEARLALWCLLAGLLAMALADSTYAYLVEVKSYEAGNLLDGGWIVGYLAIAVGAFSSTSRGPVAERADAPTITLAPIVAPFLALLAALTVIGVQAQLGERPGKAALFMACALIALVLVRQALLLFDMISAEDQEGSVMDRLYAALQRALPEAPRS